MKTQNKLNCCTKVFMKNRGQLYDNSCKNQLPPCPQYPPCPLCFCIARITINLPPIIINSDFGIEIYS